MYQQNASMTMQADFPWSYFCVFDKGCQSFDYLSTNYASLAAAEAKNPPGLLKQCWKIRDFQHPNLKKLRNKNAYSIFTLSSLSHRNLRDFTPTFQTVQLWTTKRGLVQGDDFREIWASKFITEEQQTKQKHRLSIINCAGTVKDVGEI